MILRFLWKYKLYVLIILLLMAFLTVFLIIFTSKPQMGEFIYQIN